MNKHRQRTEALRQAIARRRLSEQVDNAIEQHNFERLVEQGVVVKERDKEFWTAWLALSRTLARLRTAVMGCREEEACLISRGGGRGKG